MAQEAQKQKRKRGRPSGASNADEDASTRESQASQRRAAKASRAGREEQDVEEEARPRKRGRPSKNQEADQTTALASEKQPRKRKGQSSNTNQPSNADGENGDTEQPNQGTRKRGRPLKESGVGTSNKMRKNTTRQAEEEEAHEEEDPPSSGLRRSNRERRSWNAEEIFSAKIPPQEPEAENTSPQPKGRRRAAKGHSSAEAPQEQPETSAAGPKKKRGRPSLSEQSATVKAPASRRGKPSTSEAQEPTEEEPSQPRRRGRPRTSDASQQEDEPSESQKSARRKVRPSGGEEAQASKARGRKARSSQPDPASEEEDAESAPAYQKLATKEVKIPRKLIESKWAPLNPPSIAAVTTLLSDAQRPVLLRVQDTQQRRKHASSALALVTRRIRGKLTKGLPFPPPTATTTAANRTAAEDDFDFERTVDSIQALENTLNPLLHSIALLERETEKERAILDKELANVQTLEANARAEARSFRERGKRSHPLAPPLRRVGESGDGEEQPLELVKSEGVGHGSVFKDIQDEELISISKQIGSHMDSMKGNLQQIDGVIPAITKSKAALQRVLHENLESHQYEQILLG